MRLKNIQKFGLQSGHCRTFGLPLQISLHSSRRKDSSGRHGFHIVLVPSLMAGGGQPQHVASYSMVCSSPGSCRIRKNLGGCVCPSPVAEAIPFSHTKSCTFPGFLILFPSQLSQSSESILDLPEQGNCPGNILCAPHPALTQNAAQHLVLWGTRGGGCQRSPLLIALGATKWFLPSQLKSTWITDHGSPSNGGF